MSGGILRYFARGCGGESGNANLPIGGFQDAIQENGVPGIVAKLSVGSGFLLERVIRRAHQRP
jgi:hypothetical protein